MRVVLVMCALSGLVLVTPRLEASAVHRSRGLAVTAAPAVVALQIPDKKIEITIGDRGPAWYRSPVWIAIGILALVVLILIIALATRSGGGGGTTIIRD